MTEYIIFLITGPSEEESAVSARPRRKRLAACVKYIPAVRSISIYDGRGASKMRKRSY